MKRAPAMVVCSILITFALPVFAQHDLADGKVKDVNVVNEPYVNVRGPVEVDAYQAGEWSLNVGEVARDLKFFTGNVAAGDGWVEVYQVPTGKRFVLTDIYFLQRTFGSFSNTITLNINSSSDPCGGPGSVLMYVKIRGWEISDRDSAHFPLATGYQINEGSRICVAQTGGGLIFHNLSGYETDIDM